QCGRAADRGASSFTSPGPSVCNPGGVEVPVAEFVIALMAASAVALLARAIPICYESALAVAGLAAGIAFGPVQTGVAHSLILFEAESLADDGTGVVVFTIALAAVGSTVQPGPAVVDFLRLSLGGIALGVAVGFAVSLLTSRVDDFQVEITLTAIAAYGGYLV